MIKANKRGKIEELEGLRGMAALAVLVCHVSEPLQSLGAPFRWLAAFIGPLGGLAVMVFFILSGFVIGHTHREPLNRTNILNYVLRRLIRLYPIYLIAILLSFWVAKRSLISWDLLIHLTFLQGSLAAVIPSNGPLWSLHYEMIYYLLYLMLWCYPKSTIWFMCLSMVAVFVSVWFPYTTVKVLGLFCFWVFGCWLAKTGTPNALVSAGGERFWLPLLLFCGNLATGAWGGIAKKVGGIDGWELALVLNGPLIADIFLSVMRQRLVRWIALPAYGMSLVVTCLGLLYGCRSGNFDHMLSYPVAALFLLLAATAAARHFKGPATGFWSGISTLGGISYALYVIHYPLLKWLCPSTSTAMHIIGGCIFAVVLSFLSAWMLERHVQPLISTFLKKRLLINRTNFHEAGTTL